MVWKGGPDEPRTSCRLALRHSDFSQPRFSPLWGEHHNAVDSDFLRGLKRSLAHCRLNKRRQTKGANQRAHSLQKCLTAPLVFVGNMVHLGVFWFFPSACGAAGPGRVCVQKPTPELSLSRAVFWGSLAFCLSHNKHLTLRSLWWWREGKTQNTKQIITGGSGGLDWHPVLSTCYFTRDLLRRLSAPLWHAQGLKDGPLLGGGFLHPAFASPAYVSHKGIAQK